LSESALVSAFQYVAAGWALDLFLGRQTRPHEDLEIGVPADRFDEVAARFDTWICRRDPAIRLPSSLLIGRSAMLFKAKAPREKDEADFAGVLPMLDGPRRS
jgi:hypothetical protein